MATLAKAIAMAATAFVDKVDKGGQPYILHCLRVMNNPRLDTEEKKICGILHDGPEDKVISFEEIRKAGFSNNVLIALSLLTHDKNIPYEDYIRDLSGHSIARAVKLSDLEDNSQLWRLKGLTKKDFNRMEKYHKAYVYLSKV